MFTITGNKPPVIVNRRSRPARSWALMETFACTENPWTMAQRWSPREGCSKEVSPACCMRLIRLSRRRTGGETASLRAADRAPASSGSSTSSSSMAVIFLSTRLAVRVATARTSSSEGGGRGGKVGDPRVLLELPDHRGPAGAAQHRPGGAPDHRVRPPPQGEPRPALQHRPPRPGRRAAAPQYSADPGGRPIQAVGRSHTVTVTVTVTVTAHGHGHGHGHGPRPTVTVTVTANGSRPPTSPRRSGVSPLV